LIAIGYSLQQPRPRHLTRRATRIDLRSKKLEAAAYEEQRQHPDATVEICASAEPLVRGSTLKIWAMDEHRIGLKAIMRGVWAPVGERPIALGHHRFE
jgi:hypothetical protein